MAQQPKNAEPQVEITTSLKAMTKFADLTSAKKVYGIAADKIWSLRDAYLPTIRPDGMISGGKFTPTANNDEITVDAFTAYIGGVLRTVASSTKTITRDATDDYQVFSLSCDSAGTITVTAGTADAAALSDTRGASGGPPLIPADEIEIGQIRVTSKTAAVILDSEIFDSETGSPGTHIERFDFPSWVEKPSMGRIEFSTALPESHVGPVTKNVYGKYAVPNFQVIEESTNFNPPTVTDSTTSIQLYRNKLIGESSSTLNAGGVEVYLKDGITDPISKLDGDVLCFKFYPNRFQPPHWLGYGRVRIPPTYDPNSSIKSSATITPIAEFEKRES